MARLELHVLGLISIALLFAPSGALKAQANWQQAQAPSPGIRVNYPLSTDPVRQRILLFGGVENSATYEWDGNSWQQRSPGTVPGWRHGNSIAFDPIRNEQVMFGGSQYSNYLMETWIWNGSNWLQRFPQTSPPARRDASMVFDEVRNQIVLYGGCDAAGLRGDMWAWDGANWNSITLAASPGPRCGAATTYDRINRKIVLFGGSGPNGQFNDTWLWDGSTWQLQVTLTAPSARSGAGLAFHPGFRRTVLFGGEIFSPLTFYGDTWAWDGVSWTQVQTAVAPCTHPPYAAAFDPVNAKVLVYNGHPWAFYCGTWLFDATPAVPGTFAPLGTGCAGSAGVPSLVNVNGSVPRIGGTLNVRIAQLPGVATVCIPFFGFNNSTWNGMSLPTDLQSFGMPGCMLYTDAFGSQFFLSTSGDVNWAIGVPPLQSMVGTSFYLQSLVVDPAAGNPLGAILSNAASAVIGS